VEVFVKNPLQEFFTFAYTLESFGIQLKPKTVTSLSKLLTSQKDRNSLSVLASAPATLKGKLRRKQPTSLYEGELEGP